MPNGEPYSPDFAAIAKSFAFKAKKSLSAQRRHGGKARSGMRQTRTHRSGRLRWVPESGGGAYGWWDVPIPTYMTERRAKYESELAEKRFN